MRNLLRFVAALIALSIIPGSGFAEGIITQSSSKEVTESAALTGDWYFYVGSGISTPKHNENLSALIRNELDKGSHSEVAGILEIPGIYYQVRPGTLAGLAVNGMFENVSTHWKSSEMLYTNSWNFNASLQHFLKGTPGEGFFLRGDFGHCHMHLIKEHNSIQHHETRNGIFYQAALGWGFRHSKYSTILLHINHFYENVGEYTIDGTAGYIGFMF